MNSQHETPESSVDKTSETGERESEHTDRAETDGFSVDQLPSKSEVEALEPNVEDYSPTQNFIDKRKMKLKGIFTGEVIQACFNGEPHWIDPNKYQDVMEQGGHDGYQVLLVGELSECYFGLVVNPVQKVVIEPHVLQVNPVQAAMSERWDSRTIERMQSVSKDHQGKVWNAWKDPRIGNSERWVPQRDHDIHKNK